MKYFGRGLSEQHKELSSIIRKTSETERSKDLFLQIHAKLHSSVVSGTDKNEVDNLLCDLKQNEYAIMPTGKDETIAWGLWHIARIEDLTMNILVAREEQVFNQDWRERLNSRILGTPEGTPFYGAPEAIVVLSDSEYPNWLQDGSLVMGNLMNAAAALGIGSCWINRAMETFELPEGKALLAEWGLGENWKGVGNCILGYTDQAVLGDKARKEDRVLYV